MDAEHEALFQSGLIGVAHVRDGRVIRVNDEFARICGRSATELAGTSSSAIEPAKSGSPSAARRTSYQRDYARPDGQRRTLLIEATPIEGRDAETLFTVIDITDRQQHAAALENARALLMRAVDSMSDGFALFGPDDRIILCNQVYASTLEGFGSARSLVGMSVESIIRQQVAHGQPIPEEFAGDIDKWVDDRLAQHRRADGRPHVQELSGGRWMQSIRHRTPDGGIVVLRSDITSFKQSELLAHHDTLTGLPNRRLLHDRLTQALARSRRAKQIVAVLLVDLDGFKPVNDTYGHKAGDDVLRVTAGRLRECLRSADTVARFGGDEFIVVIDGLAQESDITLVANKILEAVARPIAAVWSTEPDTPEVQIGCSIGVTMSPRDGSDPDTLIRLADRAMYQAKQSGRGGFVQHSGPS